MADLKVESSGLGSNNVDGVRTIVAWAMDNLSPEDIDGLIDGLRELRAAGNDSNARRGAHDVGIARDSRPVFFVDRDFERLPAATKERVNAIAAKSVRRAEEEFRAEFPNATPLIRG